MPIIRLLHHIDEDVTPAEARLTSVDHDTATDVPEKDIYSYLRDVAGQPELADRVERR